MRKLSTNTFLTLDGVMQAPGGPEEDPTGGFTHGGWTVKYWDETMLERIGESMSQPFDLLLGRKTYEIFAAYWPNITDQTDPVATKLNSLPKYVVSNTLDKVEWSNSTLIRGDAAEEEITKLKQQHGNELQVHGSGHLAQTLMARDLIDEYRLWIYPVVLGSGRRLFQDGITPTALKLVDTKTTSTGVVIHVYEPAGRPTYGSIPAEQ